MFLPDGGFRGAHALRLDCSRSERDGAQVVVRPLQPFAEHAGYRPAAAGHVHVHVRHGAASVQRGNDLTYRGHLRRIPGAERKASEIVNAEHVDQLFPASLVAEATPPGNGGVGIARRSVESATCRCGYGLHHDERGARLAKSDLWRRVCAADGAPEPAAAFGRQAIRHAALSVGRCGPDGTSRRLRGYAAWSHALLVPSPPLPHPIRSGPPGTRRTRPLSHPARYTGRTDRFPRTPEARTAPRLRTRRGRALHPWIGADRREGASGGGGCPRSVPGWAIRSTPSPPGFDGAANPQVAWRVGHPGRRFCV